MIDLNGKNILVTGGCGFIGSNFIEYVNNNYSHVSIHNIDKMGVGSRDLFDMELGDVAVRSVMNGNDYNLYQRDLVTLQRDDFAVWIINIDYVFHFAAESHVDRSINSPLSFIQNNVVGITNLLEWVRHNCPTAKVVNVSTDEVYGHLGLYDEPFTEDSPIAPRSPYSASKASADLIANSYVETFRLDVVTTRCCNNYGPHQHDEKFIPTIVRSLMQGKKIPVYGEGKNMREWIYVGDHNKSILEIVEQGEAGKVYNIGSEIEMTNIEIIEIILEIIHPDGYKLEDYIEFVEDRKGHDFRYAIDTLHYKRIFDIMDFDVAMEETVNHYAEKYESTINTN